MRRRFEKKTLIFLRVLLFYADTDQENKGTAMLRIAGEGQSRGTPGGLSRIRTGSEGHGQRRGQW